MNKKERKTKNSFVNSNNNNQLLTSKSGITLIALILTIIILLILAMVSISYIMRENIIKHAETAANQYQIDAEKEAISIGFFDYALEKENGNEDAKLTVDGANNPVEKDEKTKKWKVEFPNGHVYYVDENGNITELEGGGGHNVPTKAGIHLGDRVDELTFKDLSEQYVSASNMCGIEILGDDGCFYYISYTNEVNIDGNVSLSDGVELSVVRDGVGQVCNARYYEDENERNQEQANDNKIKYELTDWLILDSGEYRTYGGELEYPIKGTIVGLVDGGQNKFGYMDSSFYILLQNYVLPNEPFNFERDDDIEVGDDFKREFEKVVNLRFSEAE